MVCESNAIKLEEGWKRALRSEFDKPYMRELKSFLKTQYEQKKIIYPQAKDFFSAFDSTPFDKVKVVILGQDPYHGPGQAHGLCFSVKPGVKIPPSLVNIYKELKSDLGVNPPRHGYLQDWTNQGVLLLNATLSVEAGKAGSHQNKGWEQFTDAAIRALNEQKKNLVYVLWGSYAQKKGAHIDETHNLVIRSAHPSPLSAHRGFLGSAPFSKINGYLLSKGIEPICWELPEIKN
ncbi:MAG: uracil-DNA glycosylase [Bdellovibrionales bacterium]|nr:uracil-DNA glycosylase [Bdellovibrionales bacterium]